MKTTTNQKDFLTLKEVKEKGLKYHIYTKDGSVYKYEILGKGWTLVENGNKLCENVYWCSWYEKGVYEYAIEGKGWTLIENGDKLCENVYECDWYAEGVYEYQETENSDIVKIECKQKEIKEQITKYYANVEYSKDSQDVIYHSKKSFSSGTYISFSISEIEKSIYLITDLGNTLNDIYPLKNHSIDEIIGFTKKWHDTKINKLIKENNNDNSICEALPTLDNGIFSIKTTKLFGLCSQIERLSKWIEECHNGLSRL